MRLRQQILQAAAIAGLLTACAERAGWGQDSAVARKPSQIAPNGVITDAKTGLQFHKVRNLVGAADIIDGEVSAPTALGDELLDDAKLAGFLTDLHVRPR